jgi:hypothetical protein
MSLPSHAASPLQAPGPIHPKLARGRGDRRRQRARDRQDQAVERQLPEREIAVDRIPRQGAEAGQQAERDRQVEVAALLGEVGRRQIDGDPLALVASGALRTREVFDCMSGTL